MSFIRGHERYGLSKKWVPESLQKFLGHLFPSKLQQLSFGHCTEHKFQDLDQ